MPMLFMGPKLQGQRDNKIYDLVQRESDQKEYERLLAEYPYQLEYYEEYLKTIGFVYEYYSSGNISPMAINGKPIFMSMRILNVIDTEKMFEYYEQYKQIREKADNF